MTKPAVPGTEAAEPTAGNEIDITAEPELTAADIMSVPVVTISARDTLWDAWTVLYRSGLRHLVVLDDGRCAGIIDDRRIALEWPLGPTRDLARRVGQIITGRVRCVLPETGIGDLARIMLRDRIEALPVVTPAGDVIGLVTASDLLLVLALRERVSSDVEAARPTVVTGGGAHDATRQRPRR